MKHILFVTYGGGHVNVVLPLIKSLERRKNIRCSVLGLTAARAKLEAAGISTLGFRDFIGPGDEAALAHGRQLAKGLGNSGVPPDESAAYLGLSYADLERQVGSAAAARRYKESGRAAFLPVGFLTRVLKHLAPDLVVTTSSPRAERAAITAAGLLGIPSVCVVDMFGFDGMEWLRQPGFADRVCVLADFVRDFLTEHGRRPDEIVVTGNPDFDQLAAPNLSDRAAALRRNRGWASKQVVLWASEWAGASDMPTKRAIDDRLIEAGRGHPDWAMAVRFHPNEASRADRFPPDWTISTQADDLATLLSAVDLVLVSSSTVGLQAALLGKRLVTYRASAFGHTVRYDELGLASACWSVADLVPTIELALADPVAQHQHLPPLGNATEKVLAVIDTFLTGGQPEDVDHIAEQQ